MNDLTLLIFTCEKFSDLWDSHVKLLEENWPDRGMDSYLVTDAPHDTWYDGVSVLAAGPDASFTARVRCACETVRTKYVFVTLDDYFLLRPVDSGRIRQLVSIMEEERLDYLRLYDRPKRASAAPLASDPTLRHIVNDTRYSVNLYAGIWRREFLLRTAVGERNPWSYEASLSRAATALKANCAVDEARDFVTLDVVRKGKILNRANRYLKKHDLYHGDRPVQSRWYEFALAVRTFGVRHMPRPAVELARRFMMKRGRHYYSQEQFEYPIPEQTESKE